MCNMFMDEMTFWPTQSPEQRTPAPAIALLFTTSRCPDSPGDFGGRCDRGQDLSGLSRRSYGPLVLPSVLGGGGLRQTQREGGTFACRQRGELAGVYGGRRWLGEGHLGAPPLAFVLHVGLICFGWLLVNVCGITG